MSDKLTRTIGAPRGKVLSHILLLPGTKAFVIISLAIKSFNSSKLTSGIVLELTLNRNQCELHTYRICK